MPVPLRVLNRLRLGREIGATIAASRSDSVAAVFVKPKVSEEAEWTNDSVVPDSGEKRLAGSQPERFIEGYAVSVIEIPSRVLENIHHENYDEPHAGEYSLRKMAVGDERELHALLSEIIPDLSALGHHSRAGQYW